MRQVRRSAATSSKALARAAQIAGQEGRDRSMQRTRDRSPETSLHGEVSGGHGRANGDLRWQAWQWALANRAGTVRCRSGARSPSSTVATTGGVAWSSARARRMSSLLTVSPASPGLRLVGRQMPPATGRMTAPFAATERMTRLHRNVGGRRYRVGMWTNWSGATGRTRHRAEMGSRSGAVKPDSQGRSAAELAAAPRSIVST